MSRCKCRCKCRCKYVVWIALFASATACSTAPEEDAGLEPVGSEARWLKPAKPPKPPRDPPGDSPPPADDPPADDPPADDPPPAAAGFVDACLLPGMTEATFYPTASFDATDEGVTAALDLPFSFTFHGTAHTKFWITPNGQLGFGNTVGGSAFGQVTCPLPDARFTTPILLAFSADLVGRYDPGAGVCYATTGTAPDRKLVVTWKDSFFYDAWLTSNVTFSATLHEGTNVIDVVIERLDAPYDTYLETGITAVLGTQSGSSAYAYSCNTENAPEGTVVQYDP